MMYKAKVVVKGAKIDICEAKFTERSAAVDYLEAAANDEGDVDFDIDVLTKYGETSSESYIYTIKKVKA